MSTRVLLSRILLAAGLAFVAGGLLLGFLPRTAAGVSCGSAFHASRDAQVQDYATALEGGGYDPSSSYAARCADTRSAARIPAVALLAVGGVLAAAGGVEIASVAWAASAPKSDSGIL